MNSDEFSRILFENEIIDNKLSESLIKMAGFRNILVHDYLDLDRELEYQIIKNNIEVIKKFMRVVLKHL